MDAKDWREYCRVLGITVDQVARRAGLSRSYTAQQLLGDRPMTEAVTEALRALAMESAQEKLNAIAGAVQALDCDRASALADAVEKIKLSPAVQALADACNATDTDEDPDA